MAITTLSGFVANGSAFADVIQDSNANTTWYRIFDMDSNQFYTEGALHTSGNWVSAESLSSMKLPNSTNNFYICSYDAQNGQSEWEDMTVSIGNSKSCVILNDKTVDSSKSISYDQVIDTSHLDSNAYLRVFNASESTYIDSSGDGWVKGDELSDYFFDLSETGEETVIWVDTYLHNNGRSGWENAKINYKANTDNSSLTVSDFSGLYSLEGFLSNPMYGIVTENDVSHYKGVFEIHENGDYYFFAEAMYQGEYLWTADEGYIKNINDNNISVYSYHDGHANVEFDTAGNYLIGTLGEGYSGDEYIKTYEFLMVQDYNSSNNFQDHQAVNSELELLGFNDNGYNSDNSEM